MMKSGGYFDPEFLQAELSKVNSELNDERVWSDVNKSKNLSIKKTKLEKEIKLLDNLFEKISTLSDYISLQEVEHDNEFLSFIKSEIKEINKVLNETSIRQVFKNDEDFLNAYIDIQSGSGGTEAQDWAEMLMRMYLKWSESQSYKTEIISISPGEVAGIKSCTIKVNGEYAYGWIKSETGVHRLVRKSPFDSGNRRHTSFASVFASPEIDNNIDIIIETKDLRVDVYRASGAGGQHVNKTESAVRLTHLPTGFVTQCQNSRSQHKNKETALKQLKAKLYALELEKQYNQKKNIEGGKADIGWGSQIRSYVLDQSRIKDLRTNYELTNTQSVLDGNINPFIEAYLKMESKNG